MKAVANVDGASFSNPGPSGIGVSLRLEDDTLVERSEDIGYGTNNQAEYKAVLRALREAAEHGVDELVIRSDSQLLVKQMTGEYKVKDRGLQLLKAEAEALVGDIERVTFEHVRREFNERADELAKAGAEAAQARGVSSRDG